MAFIIDGTTGIATVDGSVSAPSQRGQDSNSGISYAADTIKFSTNGVERLSITNSGLSGDGSGLSGIAAGITEADCWRMTANLQGTSTASTITTNLTRGSDITYIGSGMSESSGVFTFPSTGKWLIYVQVTAYGDYAYGKATIYTQVDGPSGYDTRAHATCNVSQNGGYGGASSIALVDITTTSYGARFLQQTSSTSGRFIHGNSAHNATAFTFIRLGDT
tara:strand:- start:262 stop:921 length:660 start_codon:yes stop_codon:yes gene_type:complete